MMLRASTKQLPSPSKTVSSTGRSSSAASTEAHKFVKLFSAIPPEGKEGKDGLANYMQIKDVRLLLTLACVNKKFNEVFSHPAFWQALPHAFNSKVEAKAAWVQCVNEGLSMHSQFLRSELKLSIYSRKRYLTDFFSNNDTKYLGRLKGHIKRSAEVINELPPTPLNKKAMSFTPEGDASLNLPDTKACQLF